ncbi:YchJ family protein [Blastococcus sp. TML/M2B]|uniref:YchJ family protein n=1 Tax=unclassified Blastococcus TaxID=2619396 RepID=UPI00190B387B|nr:MULTISPECIES: YchJ family protein [unclassified Blastococcus]MBN1094302.1 YchJ family protein [Blastococcus sp. TML/M2B]MBN1095580.1 YchJ family protein [Blastococcus sp. TML/C7B]
MANRRCPCGSGLPYDECCGPLHAGTTPAPTAERLMRSRYSAFVVGDAAYLRATWHPRTRPAELELDDGVRWLGLDVLAVDGGGLLATEGTVEFRAHWSAGGERGAQHEVSRFVREDGAWRYLDAV